MQRLALVVIILISTFLSTNSQILITRSSEAGLSIKGIISWNGELLGNTLENASALIPGGNYSCKVRIKSSNNFIQGPFGIMMNNGEFLLEIQNVPNMSDILLHTGNKPYHSKGCILLGPISGDNTGYYIGESHPLYKLRLKVFGSESKPKNFNDDYPNITLTIVDNVSTLQAGTFYDQTVSRTTMISKGNSNNKCKEEIDKIEKEKVNLNSEKVIVLNQLKQGKYCSQCNRSAYEIEKTGVSFSQHLKDVNGKEISASWDVIKNKLVEYNNKIKELDDKIIKLNNDCK